MKKAFWILLAALLVLTACGGGGSSEKTFEELKTLVEEKIDLESFRQDGSEGLDYNYDVRPEDVEKYLYYSPATNLNANEIIIFEAKSEEDIPMLEEKMEARAETLKKDFESYVPDQAELVENRYVYKEGKILMMIIASDVEAVSSELK